MLANETGLAIDRIKQIESAEEEAELLVVVCEP